MEARKDHREPVREDRRQTYNVTSEWRRTRRGLYAEFLAVPTRAERRTPAIKSALPWKGRGSATD
ncbi:hypothetical protein [Streptomyces sp. NBC_00996]|uniref:hypothetical protein n=1 Tax=Streptomyces sp. NBC_00996 TaxID=2903710 RepID=UPI0038665D97|nr:hypothetical protein OG390_28800 [Streptomyces sp. NBC_00996]